MRKAERKRSTETSKGVTGGKEFDAIEQDIRRLVDYLHDDEARDYEELEPRLRRGHIFQSIAALKLWLFSRERK